MNRTTRIQLILCLVLLVVVLPLSILTYTKLYSLPATGSSTSNYITNEGVLLNILPKSVVDVVSQQVKAYASSNSLQVNTLTVTGNPDTNNGTYNFTLRTDKQQDLKVNVQVTGTSVLSVSTTINGQLQPDLK